MALIRVEGLPASPLEAAARFYAMVAPQVAQDGAAVITLLFPCADHTHRGWREAAVASLARALAPRRINGIVGDDGAAIAATLAYLEGAEAMTGQLLPLDSCLPLDSHGAGEVIG